MSFAATSTSAACGKRALILSAAVLVAGLAVLFGGAGGASATSLARIGTTTQITVSPTSTNTSQSVTFNATVTAASGAAPTGSVEFDAHFTAEGGSTGTDIVIGTGTLDPGTGNSSTASITVSGMLAGTYQVTGSYSPGGAITWSSSTSYPSTTLTVGSVVLNQVTMSFTLSSATIQAGQSVTFSTTVSGPSGQPTPTGTVTFTAGPSVADQNILPGGAVQLVDGVATATIGGWSGGTYVVAANYQGDVLYLSKSENTMLTVNTVSSAVATTTTVTLTPSTAVAGGLVTITAHVQQQGTQLPPPSGELVNLLVGPAGGNPAQAIPLQGFTAVPLDADGNLTVKAAGWTTGDWTVYAGYVGDVANLASTGTASLHVSGPTADVSVPTTTSYNGATTGEFGQTVTLSAYLVTTSGATPIPSEPVTLTMGAESCGATTDGNGLATCTITIGDDAGTYAIGAAFAGDGGYLASADSGTFTVTNRPTTLSYGGDVTDPYGSTATLSSTLVDGGGHPVANQTVAMTMGSQSCSGVTNGSGVAQCTITISQLPNTYSLGASFAGGSGYAESSTSGSFVVTAIATTTAYTGDTATVKGGTATLSAQVSGVPEGATISFAVGAESCTGTVSGGRASCTVTIGDALGSNYTVTASYAGDATHVASSGSKPFTVVAPSTTTHVVPVAPVLAGSSVTLSATVSPSSAPGTVTFSSGRTTLCSATLSGGAASCSASFAQTGMYTVTATYGGNGLYPASSDTTSVLVYAFAPGGGSFVVGDKTASGTVTFWGSQWAKLNSLSGGAAPDGFKGFALNGSSRCTVPWSTDPGNSSPPPAGPLPSYMAVIVTSASTKSGSQISGNVVRLVIVQTNAGYMGDPGHAGTGTVVATISCGG